MWLWIALMVYFVGASYTVRRMALRRQEWLESGIEKRCSACRYYSGRYCIKHDSEKFHKGFAIFWASLSWPALLVAWGWWKVLFPRGVQTKTAIANAKEKALEAKNKALTEKLQQQAKEIKQLSTAAGLYVPEGL
jgi:hypothetical protein